MKVTILEDNDESDTYRCETGKGRNIEVDLVAFPFCYPKKGELWKLRNDVGVVRGVHIPLHAYQWYELDKSTGKKLRVVPDEL